MRGGGGEAEEEEKEEEEGGEDGDHGGPHSPSVHPALHFVNLAECGSAEFRGTPVMATFRTPL